VLLESDALNLRGQSQEPAQLREDRLGIGEELGAVDDVQSLAADQRLQPFELFDVPAACQVGVVAYGVAVIRRVFGHPFDLAGQSARLEPDRVGERLGFEAAGQFVRVGRVRPLDRVPQHRHHLDVR